MTTLSVQSYTCSDKDGREIRFCFAQSPSSAAADVAVHGTSAARLSHRAVLAPRQARLQVRLDSVKQRVRSDDKQDGRSSGG